jgi:serine/threonine protein kinase
MAQTQYTNTLPLDSMLMEYKLTAVLGVGGFGITYLARDTLLEKDVAIKEFFPAGDVARVDGTTVAITNTERTDDYQSGLDRFLKEARTLAGFSHPNIIRVNRYFKAHGTGYMVMDYEEGESLKTWLDKHPLPSEAQIKALLGPILGGLAKVHDAGFLHRDIKPDNIFLRTDGTPVLLDFGSARAAKGPTMRTLTALVTPGYAPFEQYTTKSHQGPWSDIYALGGVAFFAVTGENPPDALSRMREDNVADILARAHGRHSDDFLDAIAWALQLGEKERPQTVAQWRSRILGEADATTAPAPPDLVLEQFGSAEVAAPEARSATTRAPATAAPTAPATAPATKGAPAAGPSPGSPVTQDISSFLDERERLEKALHDKFQKVLTVMFTDLKGSTAIAESAGDIAVRAMLKKYHDLCMIAVNRHGGTLVKTIGDGSLSHFVDAASACRAASDIQRGMEEINLAGKYKTLLLARIGMHTGECILEKNDIFGDVVNTASRFESSAHPGEIFVSEDTYNALADKSEFYARFDREVTLKGKSMPFKGYTVFWDPKEIELDRNRPQDVAAVKQSTPAWKIAAYVAVPVLLVLAVGIWIKGGDKLTGDSRRTIEHSLEAPAAK